MKIAWFSDVHLGYAQYGSKSRENDVVASLLWLVRDAVETHGVDALICTGDLLHNNRPSSEIIKALSRLHDYLIQSRRQLLVTAGNHDDCKPGWPELVASLQMHEYGLVPIQTQLGWASWPLGRSVSDAGVDVVVIPSTSADNFRKITKDLRCGTLLLIHQAIREFVPFSTADMLGIDDLPLAGQFKAVLMGDIHVTDIRYTPEGVLYGYPGSTELHSESEPREKFWVELEVISAGLKVKHTLHPIQTRPVIDVEITDESGFQALTDELAASKTRDLLANRLAVSPLVYVKFDGSLPMAEERITSIGAAANVMLQLRPQPSALELKELELPAAASTRDLLAANIEPGPLAEISAKLLDPDADPKLVLRGFIDERLACAASS